MVPRRLVVLNGTAGAGLAGLSIAHLACGRASSAAVDSDGVVHTWGRGWSEAPQAYALLPNERKREVRA